MVGQVVWAGQARSMELEIAPQLPIESPCSG